MDPAERTGASSWMPQSLASRVFAVYALMLLLGLAVGLALMAYRWFDQHIDESNLAIEKLGTISAQTITDSAVIGDFDTIQRLLARMVPNSPLREAVYTDKAGGVIRVGDATREAAPGWLRERVAARMPDQTLVIGVGGREYGTLVMRLDSEHIAHELWMLLRESVLFVLGGLALGLLVMRLALQRWLGNLDRLQAYEERVLGGAIDAQADLSADAPLEIRKAIAVINRTAGSLRAQFGQRIDALMHSLIQHKKAMDETTIVCELDGLGHLTYANDRFVAAVGIPRMALIGQRLQAIGRDPMRSMGAPRDVAEWRPGTQVWHGEVRLVDVLGRARWHRRSVVPISSAQGEVEKYICIDIDITAQKASEEELLDQVRRQNIITAFGQQALAGEPIDRLMQQAMSLVRTGLHVTHAALLVQGAGDEAPVVRAGDGWESGWIGREAVVLPGAQDGDGLLVPSAGMLAVHGILAETTLQDHSLPHTRLALTAATTEPRSFTPADIDFLRSLAHVLTTAIERHRSREHLTYLAQFDGLTRLPNRALLLERLELAIKAAREQATGLCLLYLDLDRFKLVNDTLGHEAGDRLLVEAAQRMTASLRAGDTVARLAGDEFAIVLSGLDRASDADQVARKVLDRLCQPFDLDGHAASISASVGAALYPDHALDAQSLLRCADRAMYSAKNAGRNEVQFYRPEMADQAIGQLEMQTLLRAALEREEFFLVYQPKVELAHGRICGLEALLRWRHPERGVVSPVEFIPVLEDTGLILPVGEWVLRTVARQVMDWQALGLEVPPVAVNLSARQFASAELDEQVRAVLRDTQVPPALLELELTESMLMHDPALAVSLLERFRSYGLSLVVDDFGTGYSSLSYLSRFPLDALKVDRAFVRDMTTNPDDAAIAMTIINLAHSLKLKVVAEGVETTAQLDMLANRGCDQIQGYYVARPLPAAECEQMLRTPQALVWEPREAGGVWRLALGGAGHDAQAPA